MLKHLAPMAHFLNNISNILEWIHDGSLAVERAFTLFFSIFISVLHWRTELYEIDLVYIDCNQTQKEYKYILIVCERECTYKTCY